MTRAEYCRCGATLRVSSTSLDVVDDVAAEWRQLHPDGEGRHGPATPDQARHARAQLEEVRS